VLGQRAPSGVQPLGNGDEVYRGRTTVLAGALDEALDGVDTQMDTDSSAASATMTVKQR
jgi:hypothetical protein